MAVAVSKIYVAKVHGEYITQTGSERILKGYRATFRLPDAAAPLSIIRGKLLMPFLKKLDVNAIAPYSWHLDELYATTPSGAKLDFDPDEIPVIFQTFAQLAVYVKRARLAVPVEEYSDLELCRQHVLLAKEDPDTYATVYKKYAAKAAFDKSLAELNSGFEGIGEANDIVEVDPETGIPIPKKPLASVKMPITDDEILLS
jgi:hypothetical protein